MVELHITAVVLDPARRELFWDVFGSDMVPIRYPFPHTMQLPIGERQAYELDLAAFTPEQRERIAAGLAARFGVPVETVAADLDAQGLPILADDVVVLIWGGWGNPQEGHS